MIDPPEQNAPHPDPLGPQVSVARFVVSREKFDSVPRTRAVYIGLYLLSFILWASYAFLYLRLAVDSAEQPPPSSDSVASDTLDPSERSGAEEAQPEAPILPPWARAVRILTPICIAAFYVPFIRVLRIMGYPWVAVLAFCGFALAPIPGLLVVAYMDTRIAKAWNLADLTIQDASEPG